MNKNNMQCYENLVYDLFDDGVVELAILYVNGI